MPFRISRRLFAAIGGLVLLLGAAGPAWAADPVYSDWLGNAIKGYDPEAYFTMNKPVEGSSDISAEWNGATWHFASADNRAAFLADPEKYAPQYGGYCAYAVAQGSTAKIEPDVWAIVDGKLYLNYSKDVQSRWQADRDNYIAAADKNWPGVLDK